MTEQPATIKTRTRNAAKKAQSHQQTEQPEAVHAPVVAAETATETQPQKRAKKPQLSLQDSILWFKTAGISQYSC